MELKQILFSSKLFQRRRYIINPYFQLKYLSIVVILVLVVLLVSTYFVKLVIETTPVLENLTDLEVIAVTRLVFRTVLYVSIVFTVVIIVLGIFTTHRIAGPLYVFNKMFNLIADGDLTIHLRLRKSDELQNLALSFQNMVDKLNLFVKTDKEKVENIKIEVDKIIDMINRGEQKNLIIQKILEIRYLLDELYQNFKV